MQRRKFISSIIAIGSIGFAGCSAPTAPGNKATITDYTFTKIESENTPDEPEITRFENSEVTVRGTVTVSDGCTTIELSSTPEFVEDGGVVKSTIATADTGSDMCTQALKDIGFELSFTFDGPAPQTVRITHEGQDASTHNLPLDEQDIQ